MSKLPLVSLVTLVALAGCKQAGAPDPHFGEAVNHNILVQTVNPNAPLDNGPIAFDGQRQSLAQTRYQTGQVIEPKDMSTSEVGQDSKGGS